MHSHENDAKRGSSPKCDGTSASASNITIANLGVDLETVGGVTYPHHIFGHRMVLKPADTNEILLPGVYGEVYVEGGKKYTLQSVFYKTRGNLMRVVQATHDYKNSGRHFLQLHKNEVILISEEHPSGWWTGENKSGSKGLIPLTYICDYPLELPSDDLLRELSLIQIAQEYSVDMSTKRAPVPLFDEQILPESFDGGLEKVDLVTIERDIAALLIERETMRNALRETFLSIVKLNNTSPSDDDEDNEDDEVEEGKQGGNKKYQGEDRATTTCVKVALAKHQINALEDCEKQIKTDMQSVRGELVTNKCEIPLSLCQRLSAWLGELVDDEDGVLFYCKFLREQLQSYHREIQIQEEELSTLSTRVQDSDRMLREERDSLLCRVGLRDSKVQAYLNFWSTLAETTREQYLQEKVKAHYAAARFQEEEERLRQQIAIGRDRFICAEDEFQKYTSRVSPINNVLKQKAALSKMSEVIDRMNQ